MVRWKEEMSERPERKLTMKPWEWVLLAIGVAGVIWIGVMWWAFLAAIEALGHYRTR